MELASSVWVKEAGGFFRQQGALVSGVFIQLGHPWCRLEWGDVLNIGADLYKEYKSYSMVSCTDKYK